MLDRSLQMSLNCPSHISGCVIWPRNHGKRRLNPVIAMSPSSVILHTDESGKFPESRKSSNSGTVSLSSSAGSLLSHPNTVGIIGGVSVDSTLNFVRKLVHWSKEKEENCMPFVLSSDPVLNRELLSLERNSSPLSSRNEHLEFDHTRIVENLRNKRVFLENSGARCIVMPCHISHSWHDEVFNGCSVPSLHMGECVARELKEAKLKPLEAGSPLRIGVLATVATLKAGFYQEKLQNEGFEVVLPDKATMEHTVIPAIDALNRKDMEGARNLLRIALQVLLVRAVNTVILASDDMRDLLPRDDPLLKKCIDPMDALARSTIKWAQQAMGEGT
ncbi:Asp/Glu racemase [Corchorus olitorius]|uniref:Asp/Glu racemase n=2 Tax=Corchorus TaxID=93758 RepID=A0A1R3JZ77_9ROSI|nr:Asp/Glu racemase [Corchorus olitorius]